MASGIRRAVGWLGLGVVLSLGVAGCDEESSGDADGGGADGDGGNVDVENPLTDPEDGPGAGDPEARCEVPAAGGAADVSSPTTVIGDGTPESCTGQAVIDAVARGGVITFDCGPDPIIITLDRPAKVFNDTGPDIVIDGGGLVTLSGGGSTRILYMNTCDEAQTWTTPHCDDQDHPRLTVQNITFVDGNEAGEPEDIAGGGAIYAYGGQLKLVNTRFFNNQTRDLGPDVGGGAVRALAQFEDRPVYLVNSTFGGEEGLGNFGSNGGGISSIGVSWNIINSLFSHNRAIGAGGNPPQDGLPGGGSGGAIYNDGALMTLSLCGTTITDNEANTHGSAIIFVTNDHTGDIRIDRSTITGNRGGTWYPTHPQISNHDDTPIEVIDSVIEE